jgi:hypothetical protein
MTGGDVHVDTYKTSWPWSVRRVAGLWGRCTRRAQGPKRGPVVRQFRQFGDVRGDAPRLVAGEELGGGAASRLLLEIGNRRAPGRAVAVE